MIIRKTDKMIEEHGMLRPGDKVLCAVSGGADSVCLLHYFAGRGDVALVAAHYNHNLRGAESDRDEAFVRTLCRELGIECIVGSGDVRARAAQGMSLEEAAREMRYAFLAETAEKVGADVIATAHNLEDNAETVIMNLARGSGARGACGIAPVRGNIIRPLLRVSREEILSYLSENGLEHVEDSSNAADDYTRNRVRHHVLPLLREVNSGAVENICSAAALLRRDDELLCSMAEDFIAENLSGGRVRTDKISALPESVMMRVFRRLCPHLSSEHCEMLRDLCRRENGQKFADVPGMRVARDGAYVEFGFSPPEKLTEMRIAPGESLFLPQAGLELTCRRTRAAEQINKSFNIFCFKYESICGSITVASRREGDSIRLSGRGCTKSLKKLFSESGMSIKSRAVCPVLRDEKGVIAVYGFGIDERCLAGAGDDAIVIEIKDMEGKK